MKRKVRAALLLVLALALPLTGCGADTVSDQPFDITAQRQELEPPAQPKPEAPVTEVRLAYDVNDTLNPYTMTSQQNLQLVPLLYDSLTRQGKDYAPENQLATEIIVEGTLCTVRFNRKAQFSDGTLLTGKDIVYSVNTALASDTVWKQMLRNVASGTVNDDGDVELRLNRPDADFAALLSFPVIKEGTAAADYPTGVSKFFLSGTDGTTGGILSANHLYYADTGAIGTIRLVNVADPEALAFSLKSGDIDLAYSDLSDSDFSGLSAASVPVTRNNLVYLGVNAGRGLLARAEFRQAVTTALNRDELVSKAYLSRATATMYPFNPDFYRLRGMELSTPRNLTAADALLDGLGLVEKDADGYRLQYGKPITVSLLVNSDNTYRNAAATLIADQLKQVGIKVTVVSKAFTQYQESVAAYNYDLYIGEIKLMDNMDISPLLNGGQLGYAAAYHEGLAEQYRAYRETGEGVEAFCGAFVAQSPFIPLVFRQGAVSFNRAFRAEIVATEQDIFYNIVEW